MPCPRRLTCLATLPLLAVNVPCWGQEHVVPEKPQPILVIGVSLADPPGTPAYGSVTIDQQRLGQAVAGRVESVLLDVAGFQEFRRSDSRSANPSAQGATLRALGGNASSRTLILLDGVPVADPFFGYIPFSALIPERLGEIHVTRGGGSGAFGAGAVAGVIDMRSARRDQLPFYSASSFVGSRDAQEISAGVAPTIGSGFLNLSGRWERSDGFDSTPTTQRVSASVPSGYRDWSLGLRGLAPINSQTHLEFRGLVFRDLRTLRFAGANSGSQGQDASVRLIHNGDWGIDALAYVQTRDFTNVVISSTNFRKTLDQRATPSTGLGGKIELRPPVGSVHLLRFGADARMADGELFEDAFNSGTGAVTARRNAGGRTLDTGVFVENDWTYGALVLTGGARLDHWVIQGGFFTERSATGVLTVNNNGRSNAAFADRSGWRTSLRGGVLFKAKDTLAFRAAAYSGFRLPTLNELYRGFTLVSSGFPPGAPVSVRTEANATLGLERLKGIEGGVNLTPALGARIGVTLFYNRLNGAIANVTLPGGSATNIVRQRRNVDAIVAKGLEVTAEWRIAAFRLSAAYAYSHARVRASGLLGAPLNGRRPAQAPRHSASATFAWHPTDGPEAAFTLRHVGRQYEDDLETDILPAATTVDAFLAMPIIQGLRIVGRAENLFDKAVVTRNAGGSIDLGTPRTVWLGIRIEG